MFDRQKKFKAIAEKAGFSLIGGKTVTGGNAAATGGQTPDTKPTPRGRKRQSASASAHIPSSPPVSLPLKLKATSIEIDLDAGPEPEDTATSSSSEKKLNPGREQAPAEHEPHLRPSSMSPVSPLAGKGKKLDAEAKAKRVRTGIEKGKGKWLNGLK